MLAVAVSFAVDGRKPVATLDGGGLPSGVSERALFEAVREFVADKPLSVLVEGWSDRLMVTLRSVDAQAVVRKAGELTVAMSE